MTRSSRMAFALPWLVLLVVTCSAWRRALSAAFGTVDTTSLFVATLVGPYLLGMTGWWVSSRDRQRAQTA